MIELLSNEQMKEADRMAIERGTESFLLMKEAGKAVAKEALTFAENAPVLILCGPGNNGGDGFVAAKFLKEEGLKVRVACLVKPDDLRGDAAEACAFWGGEVLTFNELESTPDELVIDALFGAGFTGNFSDELLGFLKKIEQNKPKILAVDLPSGVNGSTGNSAIGTLRAHKTVTFFRKNTGHTLIPGADYCGDISIHDIGIHESILTDIGPLALENAPDIWAHFFPLKHRGGHKYDSGHAVLMGGRDMTGAACLASLAAMRIGAGVCSIVTYADSRDIYRNYMPELVVEIYRGIADFHHYLTMPRRNAILVGSGAGLENLKALRKAVHDSCAHGAEKACVFDGDVFTAFAECPEEFYKSLHEKCVLTPHEGEFDRIFPQLEGSKIEKARQAAELSGAVIVLKGSDTIIASPHGKTVINGNATRYLATAGAGDVLAGVLLGLLAQGMPVFEAACAGVWIHGEASKRVGAGLIASDIPGIIPYILEDFS